MSLELFVLHSYTCQKTLIRKSHHLPLCTKGHKGGKKHGGKKVRLVSYKEKCNNVFSKVTIHPLNIHIHDNQLVWVVFRNWSLHFVLNILKFNIKRSLFFLQKAFKYMFILLNLQENFIPVCVFNIQLYPKSFLQLAFCIWICQVPFFAGTVTVPRPCKIVC